MHDKGPFTIGGLHHDKTNSCFAVRNNLHLRCAHSIRLQFLKNDMAIFIIAHTSPKFRGSSKAMGSYQRCSHHAPSLYLILGAVNDSFLTGELWNYH